AWRKTRARAVRRSSGHAATPRDNRLRPLPNRARYWRDGPPGNCPTARSAPIPAGSAPVRRAPTALRGWRRTVSPRSEADTNRSRGAKLHRVRAKVPAHLVGVAEWPFYAALARMQTPRFRQRHIQSACNLRCRSMFRRNQRQFAAANRNHPPDFYVASRKFEDFEPPAGATLSAAGPDA